MSDEFAVKETVRERYGGIAAQFVETGDPACCCAPQQASCCTPEEASCCEPDRTEVELLRNSLAVPQELHVERLTHAMQLYSAIELTDLPESVTGASLGCGNPTAIAELEPGEVVLDLGSGGGIDCFLAARQVGDEGHVIGLDMTPDMIKLARQNAKKVGATNVDFRYGEMEDMPLPDESVDVIISNCVINLSPDKDSVFSEAYRVLRPGGRLAVSDMVTYGSLPQAVRSNPEAWACCVGGALDESDYLGKIRQAGFAEVKVTERVFADLDRWVESGEANAVEAKLASIKIAARKLLSA